MITIRQVISNLGIGTKYFGYRYLVYAVELVVENEERLLCVSKYLYPDIAEHFGTSVINVERNLRTVTNACWKSGNRTYLDHMAGYPLAAKPTVSDLISITATFMRDRAATAAESDII